MADAALRIDPIRPRLRWDVLSATDVERLEAGILQTLAEVGVRFPLERALDALERGGCRVDRASQVARLPESVVWAALQAAPKAPLLAARDPRCDIVLDGAACHLSNDGCGVRVLDPDTGELRPSTKADVADSARFVDAVPQVSFYWGPVVTAEDVPLDSRPLHELEAIFANTSKHFQAVDVVGEAMARRAVEMARVVAGGADELRRRPIMRLIACPIDPLNNEAVSLEAALVCAEAGVPVGFLSLTLACASAPATMAGNLVVNMAAVLAGIGAAAAGASGRAGVSGRRALRDGSQDRRVHRRQPRGLRSGRGRHAARPPLRLRHEHGHHGERGQGAGLAGSS